MKKIIATCLFVCIAIWSYSQCNPFYSFDEGSTWEMQIYDSKGKPDGRQVNEVKSLDENGDGWTATIQSHIYDKKDKLLQEMSFDMECEDGKLKFDMSRYMPEETMKAFKDMDMEFKGENLIIPQNLEVGQELDDGSLTISGSLPFTMSVVITDRKVVGKESVTVPAGTFDAYKITYTSKVKAMMNMETTGVEYMAEGVGVVKTETYKKNGDLMSSSELKSISQ